MVKTRWMKLSNRGKTIVPGPRPSHPCISPCHSSRFFDHRSHPDDLSAPKISTGWISRVTVAFQFSRYYDLTIQVHDHVL